MNMTLFESWVFTKYQVNVRSLGWAFIQYDCILIKRGNLDTEIEAQREANVKIQGKEGHLQAKNILGHQQLGEGPGAGHSLPPSERQSVALLTA